MNFRRGSSPKAELRSRDRQGTGRFGEQALEQAKKAAGGKDVSLGGGADVAQQYLAAGLVDELEISLVPLLLGDGARLFDNLGDANVKLEQVGVVEGPGVVQLEYRARR